jgi:hypothetical protein
MEELHRRPLYHKEFVKIVFEARVKAIFFGPPIHRTKVTKKIQRLHSNAT